MVIFYCKKLGIRILVPKERDPGNEVEGSVSLGLGNVTGPKPNMEINLKQKAQVLADKPVQMFCKLIVI